MSIGAEELRPPKGATHAKKRVGRGNGSGHGTYSGKGLKGQKSRSGKKLAYDAFEGGQFPTSRKFHVLRGFNNKWRTEYQPVNLSALDRFAEGTNVTPDLLRDVGILKHLRQPVKILGNGDITKKLNVSADRFSASAKTRIEQAGGTVTVLSPAKETEAS
ncbi:MAG: 50S ribosomal protein L15 [Hyphomicrobiales bacterium]